jgi:2-polyprenyl-3-methyl-5-hydroxy-6-metoxy-1,4-benzoquinol methylase
MPELTICNLCGRADPKPLFRLRDYRLRVDDVEWSAVRCRGCGLGYLSPRPTADEMARYYPPVYFEQRRGHHERYERMASYVSEKPGRLLDIGTASGDFLAVMRSQGWVVAGIEPSPDAGNPHGLEIHRMPFPEGCELPSETYDVITAWAVFEHLRDPARAFDVCARLLRPGGSLLVQVPNLRSIYSRWALQEDVPRHLYFFSERTLRAYGRTVGLELEQVIHSTDLFGGSGRGVLRLLLVRALGHSVPDFFDIYMTPRRERLRRWPLLAVAWTAAAAIEEVLLSNWLIRRLRLSGQIVARFSKATSLQASG